jgi:hypothetical protein
MQEQHNCAMPWFCGPHGLLEHLALKLPQYEIAIGDYAGTVLHWASDTSHF